MFRFYRVEMAEKKLKKCNSKERLFLLELLADPALNPEHAAIAAGYSPNTARSHAWQWIKKVGNGEQNKKFKEHLYEAYEKALEKRLQKIEKRGDEVVKEIERLGFSMITDFVNVSENGVVLKDFGKLSADQIAAVKEVSQTVTKEGGKITFKLHDKRGALEMLMRHLGLFKDVLELNDNRPTNRDEARRRIEEASRPAKEDG